MSKFIHTYIHDMSLLSIIIIWSQISSTMSLYQLINSKITQHLSTSPTQQGVKKFISTILQDSKIEGAFHQTDLLSVKQPIVVFTQMMVQDIRQNCYTYPFVVERPFSEKSKRYFFKYGHKQTNFDHELLQKDDYFSYLGDRQTVICTPIIGETEWVKEVEKSQLKENQSFEMITDQLGLFKLGEVFSAICVYEPEDKLLYFIKRATDQEIKTWTNLDAYLSKQINYQEARKKLLGIFNQIHSERYSYYLLYSLLSTDFCFISAFQNHSSLFRKLLPRVVEMKIAAPFKESFFPYKNEDDHLVRTQMQLSNLQTFVVLDFSKISTDSQVKIGPQQIDNLKALKVFVQEGNAIYRWAFGESQIKHNHIGVIVRASSIINPQYIILEQHEESSKDLLEISSEDLRQLRCYIEQVKKINPLLKEDLKDIEAQIHSQAQKFNEASLVKVMQLSKLNARSFGRDEIKKIDFENSCQIFF